MSNAILLRGIDGSNPLGFLAGVGTLRMLNGSRLGWTVDHGVWRPRLTAAGIVSEEQLCELLAERSHVAPPEISLLGKNLTVDPDTFSNYVRKTAELLSSGKSRAAEYAAAFGSEVCVDTKKNRMEYTNLSFITGSAIRILSPLH